jgi:hypothetical protein
LENGKCGAKGKASSSRLQLDNAYEMRKLCAVFLWLPLIFFLAFCIYQATRSPVHDFANYYYGSQFTLQGVFDKSMYEPLIFNQKIIASGYDNSWISYSPNPPFTTLLFIPFAYLDIEHAKFIFNIVSAILFLFSLRRLARALEIPEKHIGFIPFIFLLPIYNNVSFGQVYFFLFFLLVEGYLAMKEDKWVLCSFVWAIAIIFKITPGVLFFFLFFKRKYKGLIMLSAACLMLFSISLIVNGTELWQFYISTILPKASQGEVTAASFTINYQSAHMFLKFLFVPDSLDNPDPFVESWTLFTVAMLVVKIAAITFAGLYTRREGSLFSSWSVWILVSFLISPYSSTYTYILLLIPLFILYRWKKAFIFYALLTFLLINIPANYLYSVPLLFQFPRLYLLLILFVTIIASAKIVWNWKTPVFVACLFISIEVLTFRDQAFDNSTYLFDKHAPPLIYDYTIEDGYFCYAYWSDHGTQKHKTGLPAVALDFNSVEIIDNQIYYNDQQITSTSDKKVKASILDNNTIVYLSDKGRGYGFYAFRKITLSANSL